MSSEWYVANASGQRLGPYSDTELRQYYAAGRIRPDDLVWRMGMTDWAPIASVIVDLDRTSSSTPPPIPPEAASAIRSKRIAAGILGIFLGAFGIHKFVLGFAAPGILMPLLTLFSCGLLSPVTSIIGLIEDIIYLCTPDADFYRKYVLYKQEWF